MPRPAPSLQRPLVLTGPTGWIGQALLASLAGREAGAPFPEVRLFGSREGSVSLPDGRELPVRPLETITGKDTEGAHCVHLAYLTKEKADMVGVEAFNRTNRRIDDALIDAAREGRPASIFVASSGAASLAEKGVDLHPYGLAKLEQEARFLALAAECGIPSICGRIFNLAGPYINKLQSYAMSNFALQAVETGRIEIAARVPVFRSYLHIRDLTYIILAAAARGARRDRPIDLCGSDVVEMQDIASRVAARFPGVAVHREALNLDTHSVYVGNFIDTKILAMELAIDVSDMDSQVDDTLAWLQKAQAAIRGGTLVGTA